LTTGSRQNDVDVYYIDSGKEIKGNNTGMEDKRKQIRIELHI